MSSQSSVYSEKKIAAYDSLFKESNFAKPLEVSLTITVAHLFGQAYILEQEGTKEGDPVYSRFVCPLEDITKVYVNDKTKKPWPLFIQCDTDVKGVIHRKRIVVPCLENPGAIADQINEVKSLHMQKYEAAVEREKQRKREELESARLKEQKESAAKSKLPSLDDAEPMDSKLPDQAGENPAEEKAVKEIKVEVSGGKVIVDKPEDIKAEAAPEVKAEAPAAETKPDEKPAKKKKGLFSASDLSSALEDSFKAFAKIDKNNDGGTTTKKPVPGTDIIIETYVAPKKEETAPETVAETASETAPEAVVETVPEAAVESVPETVADTVAEAAVEAVPEEASEYVSETAVEAVSEEIAEAADVQPAETFDEGIASISIDEEVSAETAAEGLEEIQTVSADEIEELNIDSLELEPIDEDFSSAPADEAAVGADLIPEIVLEEISETGGGIPDTVPSDIAAPETEPIEETAPEAVPAAAPAPAAAIPAAAAPAHKPAPVRVNPNGKASELGDFESAVLSLKAKLDEGSITAEEFAAEKKRLISTLY